MCVKLVILSFYYKPDLCAGSFRCSALVEALLEVLPSSVDVELITTMPNRYGSFEAEALPFEKNGRLTVTRIKLPSHQSGMKDQSKAFFAYAKGAIKALKGKDIDMVVATSSRLMTAVLGAYVARKKHARLYLDIRDIFVDTIKDVLPAKFALVAKPIFSKLESWAIRSANKVNLISAGFENYFNKRYPNQSYSFYTNGIDREFLQCTQPSIPPESRENKLVLYAGNIGEGQGLHAIIPQLAARYKNELEFRIIGDGGRKAKLEQALSDAGCENVVLEKPVPRRALIDAYANADVLFMHLNDYDAFEKVLPSKVFEYAAMGKPIWAGVAGYAAKFVGEEVTNAGVFKPCDVESAVEAFDQLQLETAPRLQFVEKYARASIMHSMAEDICQELMR